MSSFSPTLGSLFAGIGGFDLGFERAGFKTLWACEIDPQAQSVLRRHFPGAALHDDVRKVGAHNLAPVDVLTFGSPCQDLSVAGKRAGLAGERSGLFHEAARVIQELRAKYGKPDFAIWENVPGAFSSNDGRDFAVVVQTMVDLGARDVAWRILDSRYFNVAQRRKRVFLVADFAHERAESVLFEPESLRWNSEEGYETWENLTSDSGEGSEGGRKWPADVTCTLNTLYGDKLGLENQHALNGTSMFVPAGQQNLVTPKAYASPHKAVRHPPRSMLESLFDELDGADASESDESGGDSDDEDSRESETTLTAYAVHGERSSSLNSDDPNVLVARPIQVARTLDTTGGFAQGQGGTIVGSFPSTEQLTYTAPHTGEFQESKVASTLTANSGSGSGETQNAAFVLEQESPSVCYALMPQNSGKDFKAKVSQVAQPLMASGPLLGNQGGDVILQPATVMAFAQNTREEVRLIGGDGRIAGALSAQSGTHQTSYIVQAPPIYPVPMINMQGSKGMAVTQEDGPSFTLNAMHGHDVHAVAVPQDHRVLAPTLTSSNDPSRSPQSQEITMQVAAVVEAQVGVDLYNQTITQDVSCTVTSATGSSNGSGPKVMSFSSVKSVDPIRYGEHQQDTLHHESGIMSTLPSGSNANGGHYTTTVQALQVRRLTPTECERLQGFPDGWTEMGTFLDQTTKAQPDGARYKQLGNAVTVNVAEWIGHRIAQALKAT